MINKFKHILVLPLDFTIYLLEMLRSVMVPKRSFFSRPTPPKIELLPYDLVVRKDFFERVSEKGEKLVNLKWENVYSIGTVIGYSRTSYNTVKVAFFSGIEPHRPVVKNIPVNKLVLVDAPLTHLQYTAALATITEQVGNLKDTEDYPTDDDEGSNTIH